MKAKALRNRAFSIVEMLVVIGIIAVLMALMFPALSGVQSRSQKLQELNQIRQVGMAWNMYASSNKDAALPGYLDHDAAGGMSVQDRWRVRYEYPVAPDPATPGDLDIPQEFAAPWTWRLAQYLDYSPDVLQGYRRDAMNDIFALMDNAQTVATEPSFAYNGYYVGGWWEMTGDISDPSPSTPRTKFWDARDAEDNNARVNVVSRSVASIQRAAELVLFCSATEYAQPGLYRDVADDIAGTHIVVPPSLATEAKWRVQAVTGGGGGVVGSSATGGDPYTVETLEPDVPAPLARHTSFAAVLYADGSTDTQTASSLAPMTNWIDRATSATFRHTE